MAGKDNLGPGTGIAQVEPDQVATGRHYISDFRLAHKRGGLNDCVSQVEKCFRMLIVEEALAHTGQQGHGPAATVGYHQVGNPVVVHVANSHGDGAVAA